MSKFYYLAYIINSTGTDVCVLIPATTWFAFMLAQMEAAGIEGGASAYFAAIPFMFYPWIAVLMVPLVILGIVPMYGPLKKAEERAKAGQVLPESTYEEFKDQVGTEDAKKNQAHLTSSFQCWLRQSLPLQPEKHYMA